MRKVFWSLIVVVLAIGIFYVINRKPDCASIELKKLDLQGDSQLLIGYSDVKDDLLSLSLSFAGDSTQFEIFGKTKGLISQGFSLGDYLSDSVMLVFDEDQKPFLYNQSTGVVDTINSLVDFAGLEMADVKVKELHDREGIFLNKGDSIIFYDVLKTSTAKLFSLNELSEKYESVKSFDVFGDKILIVLKHECIGDECDYDYLLYSINDSSFKKIFSLSGVRSITYPPMVSFLNSESYVTSYFSDQSYLIENSINGTDSRKWCLGDLKVFNMATAQGEVYLTVINEQERNNSTYTNPFRNLYSGISIVSAGRLESVDE